MRPSNIRPKRSTPNPRRCEQGRIQTILLAVVCVTTGFGLGAFWYYHHSATPSKPAGPSATEETPVLSDSTKAVIANLRSPVEIRYYSLLSPDSVSESLRAFAGRVDHLLSAYQSDANGMIRLIRVTASDSSADEASADGIRPFNLDKGDACYLGITVANKERKESLAQISPQWEPALEYDLSRIIERIGNPQLTTRPAVNSSAEAIAAARAVRSSLPNLESMSLEAGTQILRENALQKYKAGVNEMEAQVKQAQQKLASAKSNGSEAEQEAAMKQLQQVQAEHRAQLKQLARQLQEQMAALEQLKAAAAPSATATNSPAQLTPAR